MKILLLSGLYPSDAQPRHGIFIEHRVAHIAQPGDEVRVVAPVPWFPSRNPVFGRYAEFARAPRTAMRRGIAIDHPRIPVIPGLARLTPGLMAAALYRPITALRRTFDFDVIDAYYLYPDGVAASRLAAQFDVPVVLTALGSDVTLIAQRRAERAMIVAACAGAAAVTAVCGALRDELVGIGVDAAKTLVVEHGVDLDLFRPPADRAALRTRLGIARPTVLIAGHLIDLKGQDLAIRAIARLPGVRLMIAGHGPNDAAYRALAVAEGVAERVDFLGHVDQARLVDLYGAVDVVANCSEREGISNVLLEALACGTPLVATPVWGSPEVVKVPEAGVLTSDRSVDAIARGMAAVLADPPDRGATRRYAERYDWNETGRLHRVILAQAVAAHRRAG
ncbi:glycosyltransferase [Sphingomonas oligophenolica]|uniref:Glycosyltransferase family 4 protein n=1 Tax=Sphingomonas oligophenolica TaxID=301154 RepID=A0A502CPN7_9SPHN|nr:glycosyltransferase [Sphingomonas oligophenolica]TPG14500.1 glycosyltransferase family 4 protein [Sphingomonas oligophenolica]